SRRAPCAPPHPAARPEINRPAPNPRPDANRPDNNRRPDFNKPDNNNRPNVNRPDNNRPNFNRPNYGNNRPIVRPHPRPDYSKYRRAVTAPRRFHAAPYRAPHGYAYRRWSY